MTTEEIAALLTDVIRDALMQQPASLSVESRAAEIAETVRDAIELADLVIVDSCLHWKAVDVAENSPGWEGCS